MELMTSFELKWEAPEFEYREKGVSWYWISIIIAALLIGLSVWQKNFLFGFFIVAAEVLVLAWANRKPALIKFALNERGLSIGGRTFHPYTEIESFGIDDYIEQEWPNLYFQFHKRLRPLLKIRAPHARVAEIQKTLAALLPQVKHERSLLDALEEFVRF
jgi:hypothetical protein